MMEPPAAGLKAELKVRSSLRIAPWPEPPPSAVKMAGAAGATGRTRFATGLTLGRDLELGHGPRECGRNNGVDPVGRRGEDLGGSAVEGQSGAGGSGADHAD